MWDVYCYLRREKCLPNTLKPDVKRSHKKNPSKAKTKYNIWFSVLLLIKYVQHYIRAILKKVRQLMSQAFNLNYNSSRPLNEGSNCGNCLTYEHFQLIDSTFNRKFGKKTFLVQLRLLIWQFSYVTRPMLPIWLYL